MKIILYAARLALPIAFFSYAILANLSVLSGAERSAIPPQGQLLSGGLTRDLDSLYKQDLPHMDLSFGLIGAARYALLGEARAGAIVGQDGWLFTTEELRPLPSDTQLDGVVAAVSDISTQLRAVGADLVVVPLPAKIDIYRDLGPDPAFGEALNDLYAEFYTRLNNQGVAAVNVRNALLHQTQPVFFATDTHWTPYGAARIAEATAESGAVPLGALKYERSPETAKVLTGDLVRFVTTPDIAPHIGLQRETVVPSMQSQVDAALDLFGTVETDIVLVGTSYSANPDWGFADALMLSLGRNVISMAKEGLGPLKPMQDYLSGSDFRDTPPKVVIWEIPIRFLTDPTLWPEGATPARDVATLPTKENSDG